MTRGMDVDTWVLLLAGGDGRRLQGITRDAAGRAVPKQYCDFGTGRSLLGRTLDRALQLAPHDRVMAVVAERHREWWERELDALPAENLVVQAENRGTAAGILLPLLRIHQRDPHATVVVLPSDHHVEDEATLHRSVNESKRALSRHPHSIILLGITPTSPDSEYGWVLPDASDESATHPVAAFVEKPVELEAIRLMARGALWNSFMFTTFARTLLDTYEERMPRLLAAMHNVLAGGSAAALAALYRAIEAHDFSREVLQLSSARLRVMAVPACGWTDLGTPERLARLLPVAEADTTPGEEQSAA